MPERKHQSHLKISGQSQRLWVTKYRFVRKMRLMGSSRTRNSLCITSIITALDRVWLEAIGIGKTGRQVHTPAPSHSPLHFPSCTDWLQTCSLKTGGIFSKEYPQSQFKQKHLIKLKFYHFCLSFHSTDVQREAIQKSWFPGIKNRQVYQI